MAMDAEMKGVRKFLINQATTGDLNTNILQFLYEKLILLLHSIAGIVTYLPEKLALFLHFISEKFDELFPPETRPDTIRHWLHILLTVVLPVSLALLVLYWCCRCCSRRRGFQGKMMKAPGRSGALMPRDIFEASPSNYFTNLRAGNPLS